jgi:hypothetical protein
LSFAGGAEAGKKNDDGSADANEQQRQKTIAQRCCQEDGAVLAVGDVIDSLTAE